MGRTLRTFLTPRWMALHLLVWTAALVMVWLGRWQLDVSNRKHFDLQNFSYTLQWWAFSAAAVWFWLRLIRDRRRGPAEPAAPTTALAADVLGIPGGSGTEVVRRQQNRLARTVGPADLIALTDPSRPDDPDAQPAVYRGYLMPQSTRPARSDADSTHAAYNDYLWQLSMSDESRAAQPARTAPTEEPVVTPPREEGGP